VDGYKKGKKFSKILKENLRTSLEKVILIIGNKTYLSVFKRKIQK